MTFTLTRQQLDDLVWSEAMRNLAARIGISDVAIAKHCRKCNIPVPPRGHWNKLQAGKKTVQTPLEPPDLGSINLITLSGTLTPELRARIKGEPGDPGEEDDVEALVDRFRKRLGKVAAPRSLTPAHPAIATLLRKDEELRRKQEGSPFPWYAPKFDSPFERRRLRVLNGIFLGIAKTGGSAWTRGETARELGLHIGNRGISFELDHPAAKRGRTVASPGDKNAKLILRLAHDRFPPGMTWQWEDKDGCPLENQLTDIIVGLVSAAERLHRQWQEEHRVWQRREQERKEREEQERRELEARRERERLAAIEKAKVDALLQDAADWRKAAEIRAYVEAVLAQTSTSPDETFENWRKWALSEADKLDPIVSRRPNPPTHQ
ncbi:MAG: hypothetical protein GC129_03720 [Proteobacteria bacterium]|nr:hypothetical protein [Pseudomonadota bacterium]